MKELIKKYFEDYWEEHGEEAIAEARMEGITKIVIQMLKAGKYALDEISSLSGLSIEEIKAIKNANQL